jgi:hypothetical protein
MYVCGPSHVFLTRFQPPRAADAVYPPSLCVVSHLEVPACMHVFYVYMIMIQTHTCGVCRNGPPFLDAPLQALEVSILS